MKIVCHAVEELVCVHAILLLEYVESNVKQRIDISFFVVLFRVKITKSAIEVLTILKWLSIKPRENRVI